MIVLGSGGHTGELLQMISKLDFNRFSDAYFVSSHNDKSSDTKAREIISIDKFEKVKFEFIKIYRSRNVDQSFKSSIFTTLYAFIQSVYIILRTRPSIVVTNGPGVAIPLVFAGYFWNKLLVLTEFKILFIESYCRTKSISLAGKFVQFIADRFIVLWECLKNKKREYLGKIL
jgi:beta-1,4-N-acetylglucosaminyltransferase